MTAKKYDFTKEFEQVRVYGGDVSELCRVLNSLNEVGATWHTDSDTIVFEWPMGTQLTGGEDYLEGV